MSQKEEQERRFEAKALVRVNEDDGSDDYDDDL